MKTKPSILFIGKKNDFYCQRAQDFIRLHFPASVILLGKRGDPAPAWGGWEGDYIVSYLSPWIVPSHLLRRATKAAINFHPGPPEYPGIGCTNFAIYDEVNTFGVTCHHMEARVDAGDIIAVKRFPLYETDTVFSLTQRCYGYILALFYQVMSWIPDRIIISTSEETWQRAPTTRRQLDALCRVGPGMSRAEIRRRVRAVTFPGAPGAYVEIDGMRFEYSEPSTAEGRIAFCQRCGTALGMDRGNE